MSQISNFITDLIFAQIIRGRVNEFQDPDKAYVDFVNRQKMKRLGSADEIAGAVLFLASKNVRYDKYIYEYMDFKVCFYFRPNT